MMIVKHVHGRCNANRGLCHKPFIRYHNKLVYARIQNFIKVSIIFEALFAFLISEHWYRIISVADLVYGIWSSDDYGKLYSLVAHKDFRKCFITRNSRFRLAIVRSFSCDSGIRNHHQWFHIFNHTVSLASIACLCCSCIMLRISILFEEALRIFVWCE